MSPSSAQALSILRDTSQFSWYIIPVLLVVIYVYTIEIEKRNFGVVLAALAFWGMDWFNEIWNSLIFHFTGFAPVWGAPAHTAYLILIGLNIEITFMFLIMGICATKMLPKDKNLKILGINNRIVIAVIMSIFCCIVEIILNAGGWLTWEYRFWQRSFPFLLFLIGYLPFWAVCYWVYDLSSTKKQLLATGSILAFDIICLIIFGPVLRWI
jgi:hypothetical protein